MIRLLLLLALLVVLASASAVGSIPPFGEETQPEPETACAEYLATPTNERIDQWIFTFQSGLLKNPELEQEVWVCVMDIYKMSETDQFMLRACKADLHAPFQDLAFKALSGHLDQCGIGVSRD